MAKKARVPRPPVQAPRQRVQPKRGGAGGGIAGVPRWAWAGGGAALVAAIVVVVAVAMSGGSSGSSEASVAKAMSAAGCSYKSVAPLPPKKNSTDYHADVPSLTTPTKGLWNTFPPAGGSHYPAWAVWGFYRQPVNPRQVVHNEEHGAVVIWWGPQVPASTVDKLEAFYQQKPAGMFGTPIAGLGKKIALTAWTDPKHSYYSNGDYGVTHVAICTSFDQKAFATFRDAFRGKGPEGIPLSADQPGMGPQ